MSLTHLSLFSGVGAESLAAGAAGFTTVQFVEIDPFCREVLSKRFPGTPIHGDIRTFDATGFLERIGLLTGGFPCQGVSAAGMGAGLDDERSGLWAEMFRVVRECRPLFLVAENSPFLRVRGADRVCADLESEGYAVEAFVVGAGNAGAPHQRQRVFFVGANAQALGWNVRRWECRQGGAEDEPPRLDESPHWLSAPFSGVLGMAARTPAGLDRLRALGNCNPPAVYLPFYKHIAKELTTAARSEEDAA